MRSLTLVTFLLSLLAGSALTATPADWRSRSIYQVVTDRFARTDGSTTSACNPSDRVYCGGTFQGIINQLDYIKNMGFTAIWISPVVENYPDGQAYHGYWARDIYSINSNFGTAEELQSLAQTLHDNDMYLMVDVAPNHFGTFGPAESIDYTQFSPFNSQDYFHPLCFITNYDDQTNVEECWLGDDSVPLPDVDTDLDDVVSEYNSWIQALVSNYSIDGLRVDTVKHVAKEFWTNFNDAAGVYAVGEVYHGDPLYTCPYQNYMDGVLNYPIYYPLIRAFQSTSGSISDLTSMISTVASNCADTTLLGTFSENHDVARFPSYTSDYSLAKNVIAYNILSDGIPIIYQGQEQHLSGDADPVNREAIWLTGYDTSATLYKFIASVNQLRNTVISLDSTYVTTKQSVIYSDTNTIALKKGSVVTVLSNRGASGSTYTQTITGTGYTSGDTILEILTCETLTAGSSGSIAVPMSSGLPRIYYPSSSLSSTGICSS